MTKQKNIHLLTFPTIAKCHENIDFNKSKKILIAGEDSYIGKSFKEYVSHFANYRVDSFDTRKDEWKKMDFSIYDVVFDVAGITHVKETQKNRHLFYEVNRDLAVEIAKKAKSEGVGQFIYISSMSVYGLLVGRINKSTPLKPVNAYGKSKLEAEMLLWQLNSKDFRVSIVRPPMVYGDNCKGNYQRLRSFALRSFFFPEYDNERSMLYIDNLSSAIRGIIHNEEAGLYFPQDMSYVRTFDMVKAIAKANKKKCVGLKAINLLIRQVMRKSDIFKKVFGTLTYEMCMNVPKSWILLDNFEEIINEAEGD